MTYRPIIGASSVSRDYGYTAGGNAGSSSAVTEKYDDVANTWTNKNSLNTPRYTLAGFSLNGYGYTAGGTTGSNSAVTEKYDDVANTWTAKTSLNTARTDLAGFSLNGYGYIVGGYISSASAISEKYDDVANTWTTKGSLNTARYVLTGFSLNGYGYTAGGYTTSVSAITEKYDDVINTWAIKSSLNTARYTLAGFSLNGYGYTAGGNTGSANAITEKYDDVANTWVTKGGLNTARYYLAGFSLNGYGYTAGGYTTSISTVTEKYDDVAGIWTSAGIATLNTARYALAGFSLGALGAGVQNPEINPIYKTINKSKIASVWLGAEAAYLPATNPATFNEVSGSTTYTGWSYLAFDDTTAQMAVWRVPLSKYDGGNIVVKAFSKPQTTPTGTVTLQYNILTIGLSTGGEFNSEVLVDTGINISHSLSTSTLSTQVQIASATILPSKHKKITINNNSGGALTDYQIPITVTYEASMQSNFNNIRFIDSSGNILPYWIESKTDSSTARIWIKANLPNYGTSPIGDNTVYMYYGNSSIVSTSDGINTLIFLEHFRDGYSLWSSASSCGNWTVNNDYGGIDGYGLTFRDYGACGSGNWIYARRTIDMGTGGRRLYYSVSTESYFLYRSLLKLKIGTTELWSSGGNGSLGNYVQYYLDISSYGGTQTLELRAEQTSSDWPGQSIWDAIYICKYVSPEPTVTVGTEENVHIAPDDLLVIGIQRDVTSDNLAGNGQLLGILLEYTKA